MAVFSLLTNKSYQGNMKKVIQNIERMYNLFYYYKAYGKGRQYEKESVPGSVSSYAADLRGILKRYNSDANLL